MNPWPPEWILMLYIAGVVFVGSAIANWQEFFRWP